MAAKTVALDPEAYDLLRRQKRAGETFSDAVKRLAGGHGSILDYAGIWKDIPEDDIKKLREFLAEGRRRDRIRMNRLLRGGDNR